MSAILTDDEVLRSVFGRLDLPGMELFCMNTQTWQHPKAATLEEDLAGEKFVVTWSSFRALRGPQVRSGFSVANQTNHVDLICLPRLPLL